MRDTHEAHKISVCNLEVREEHTSMESVRRILIASSLTVFLIGVMNAAAAEKYERASNTPPAFARLYNFCSVTNCSDGTSPAGLTQGLDGNFYGTTYGGGINNSTFCYSDGCGTVYKT